MTVRLARALVSSGLSVALVASMAAPSNADALTASLRQQIEQFVTERAGGPIDSVSVPSLGGFALAGVDASKVRIELSTRARGRLAGPVAVNVVLSDERQVLKRGVVTASVGASASVWVAARGLSRGALVTRSDLRLERVDARSVPTGATADADRLVGLKLRRAVREGAVLRTRYVEVPTQVERGQIVRLVLRGSGLKIIGKGRAVTDGVIGQHIRVVNTDSRREVMGLVAQDGSVHVGL